MPRKVSKEWNTYESVKSGEVCSILTAKKLGIYDGKSVVKNEYDDVKTYAKYVSGDVARTKQLCNQNIGGTSSLTACEVEHGMGFIRKPGTVDQCITVGCPTNFKVGKGGVCQKPTVPFIMNASSKCNEKSYDWYAIHNYHLGNTHQFHNAKCQAPCPLSYVPNYGTDPVDQQSVSSKASDDLSKCVTKQEYMSGKYVNDQDFCPMAWIKRMNASPSTIEKEIKQGLPEYISGNVESTAIGNKLQDYVKATATEVATQCNTVLENVIQPSLTMATACKKVETDQRLVDTYKICEALNVDEEGIRERLKKELNESDARITDKLNVMRQACNMVFCESNSDKSRLMGRKSICFEKVPRINPSISDATKSTSPNDSSSGSSFQFKESTTDESVQSTVVSMDDAIIARPFLTAMYGGLKKIAKFMMIIVIVMIIIYIIKYVIAALLERIGVMKYVDAWKESQTQARRMLASKAPPR